MKTRTTLILALVAIAMGAYIYFHERLTIPQSEIEERGAHLLKRFVRARLQTVSVERNGRRWMIERIPEADESVDLHVWRVAAPVQDAADDESVNALLGSLEWADPRRTLVGVTATELHEYGLDHPRLRATLHVADEDIRIAFGAEVPGGEGVYLSLGERDKAFVVGKDFYEALDFDIDHFRSKTLFDGRSAAGAVHIALRNQHGAFVMDRPDGHRWWLREPYVGYAQSAGVDALLNAFESAQARRFVAEDASRASQYGLDPALSDVRVTMSRPDGGTASTMRMRLGNVCADHPDEVYAMADESGPIVCVTSTEVAAWRADDSTLFEARMFTTPDESVESISIEAGGRRLVIRRDDDGWKYETLDGSRGTADETAVSRLMAALRAATVRDQLPYATGEAGPTPRIEANAGNLHAHGLDHPYAKITITKSDNGGTEVVALGREIPVSSWVRRGDEPVLLQMHGEIAPLFDPDPILVRPLALLEEDDARAQQLSVSRGPAQERIELVDGRWTVISPVRVPAARAVVAGFLRRFATLTAQRFVGGGAAAVSQLGEPNFIVSARFGTSVAGQVHEHTLRVYQGRLGRLDGEPAVFELEPEFATELPVHFADRDALATDPTNVASISLQQGTRRRQVVASDTERQTPLFAALASLHASSVVEYGTDIGAVRGSVTVTRTATGPEPHTMRILIGRLEGEGETATTLVRREDLEVVYRVLASSLTPFLLPAEEP